MAKKEIRKLRKQYADLIRLRKKSRDEVLRLAIIGLYHDGAPIVYSKLVEGKKVLKISASS